MTRNLVHFGINNTKRAEIVSRSESNSPNFRIKSVLRKLALASKLAVATIFGISAISACSETPANSSMNDPKDGSQQNIDAAINDGSQSKDAISIDRYLDGQQAIDSNPNDRQISIDGSQSNDLNNSWPLSFNFCHNVTVTNPSNNPTLEILAMDILAANFTQTKADMADMQMHPGTCANPDTSRQMPISPELFAPNQLRDDNGNYKIWFRFNLLSFDFPVSLAIYHGDPLVNNNVRPSSVFVNLYAAANGINWTSILGTSILPCANDNTARTCFSGRISVLSTPINPNLNGRILEARTFGMNGSSMIFGISDFGGGYTYDAGYASSIFVIGNSLQASDGTGISMQSGLQRPQNAWTLTSIAFPNNAMVQATDENSNLVSISSNLPRPSNGITRPNQMIFIAEPQSSGGQQGSFLYVRSRFISSASVSVGPELTK
ncbi:MAG: hypothetical protein AABX38_05940 [Candidatus Micrarchaeota archaeon]